MYLAYGIWYLMGQESRMGMNNQPYNGDITGYNGDIMWYNGDIMSLVGFLLGYTMTNDG